VFHELTHWTGHKSRLDRDFAKRFGDEAYAMEELVAELGAAFLCAKLGVSNEPRPDHAAYVDGWLRVLGNDRRAIFVAAGKAGVAVDSCSINSAIRKSSMAHLALRSQTRATGSGFIVSKKVKRS